jgi:hypothetical protein
LSDPRYQADIMKGLRGNRGCWALGAWPWPLKLPGLGSHCGGQPFANCADCPPHAHPFLAGTFTRYGGRPLCLAHAVKRAA